MTNISGYFNSNPWPLILWVSELNLQIQVAAAPPNRFVQDDRGNRINDPILDKYCGQKMLQREVSQEPVPILLFTRNPAAAKSDERKSPVSSVKAFARDSQGRTVAVPNDVPETIPAVPLVSTNPVRGLTIEQARKAGLARPTKLVPEDFGAPETAGAPTRGQIIPTIEYAQDLGPRAVKALKLNEELTRPLASVASQPARQAVLRALHEGVGYDPDSPDLPEIVTRRKNIGLPSPVQDERRVAPYKAPVEAPLPEPMLEETIPPPAVPVPVSLKFQPFVCLADGKGFPNREQLLIYITETFPDSVAELMEPYPAIPKKRPRNPALP